MGSPQVSHHSAIPCNARASHRVRKHGKDMSHSVSGASDAAGTHTLRGLSCDRASNTTTVPLTFTIVSMVPLPYCITVCHGLSRSVRYPTGLIHAPLHCVLCIAWNKQIALVIPHPRAAAHTNIHLHTHTQTDAFATLSSNAHHARNERYTKTRGSTPVRGHCV